MPVAVREVVRERLGLPVPLYPRVSYADIALLVLRYRKLWRAKFLAHLSGEQA